MATELATAYIQLVPSFRGGSRAISDELGKEGAAGGKKFAKGFEGQTSKMGKKVAIGASLVVAGAAVAKFATSSANAYKSIGMDVSKLSRLTGMSTEQASKLRFEFQQTGIDANKGAQGVVIFSKKVAASKDGMKDFGFQTRDANGNLLPMSELLANAADHLSKTKSATDRTAESMKLFGRGGADMAKLLGKGSDAMAKLGDEAGKYGLILTEKNLNAVKQATENERKQTAAMQGLQVQVGQHVLPIMTKWTGFMATEIPKATGFLHDHAGAFKVLSGVVGTTVALFGTYKAALLVTKVATGAWTAVTSAGTAAQWAWNHATTAAAGAADAAGVSVGTLGAAAAGAAASIGLAVLAAHKLDEATKFKGNTSYLLDDLKALGAGKGSTAAGIEETGMSIKGMAKAMADVDKAASYSTTERWMDAFNRNAGRGAWESLTNNKAKKAKQNIDAIDKALAEMVDTGDRLGAQRAYAKLSGDLIAAGAPASQVARYFDDYWHAADHAGKSTREVASASSDLSAKWYAGAGKAIADATNKYKAWRTEVDNAWAALKRLTDYKLGIVDANLAYAQAVADQQAGVKERGTVLGYGSQAGRDNIAAAEASRRAILQQAEALRTEKDGAKKAADFIAAHVVQLNAQELAMGYTRDQVDLLNAAMGMTPSQVITEMVTKPRIDKQRKAIDDYNAWVAAHPAYHITNDQIIAHGGYGTVDPALGPAAANAGTYSSVPTGASIGSGGGVSGSGGVHRSGGKSIGTVNIYGAKDDRQMLNKLLWAQGR